MSAINDGGPAFPVMPPCDMEGANASGYPYPDAGMSLRDYLAAKAMQAGLTFGAGSRPVNDEWFAEIARASYAAADTMLRAREGKA